MLGGGKADGCCDGQQSTHCDHSAIWWACDIGHDFTVELNGAYAGQFTLRHSIRDNRNLTGNLYRHRNDNNVHHQH